MPKSPEQFYEQHHKDAERVEKAKSTYDKHLEEAREAGDLTKHPELWDQASAEYQAEAKEKIAEVVKAGNYDVAEELIRGLRAHLDTVEKYKEQEEKPLEVETPTEKIEGTPVVNETREEILGMVSEADWQRAKDKTLGMLQSGYWEAYTLNQLAEMRKFDPERFDKEIEVVGNSWQQLMEKVEREESYPEYYLLSARDLKAVNPKLFEEQFWARIDSSHKENNWKRIMEEVRQSKNYPREFLWLASAVKDLDPERFQQEIGASEEFTSIWPRVVEEVERIKKHCPECFAMAAGAAQNIKPENEPDITMDEKTWNELKKELDYALRDKMFRIFFSMANNSSRLKVEKK
ncbi:hypothetical protein HY798_02850 [Candidatus Falkowbacteria bacterium]|nr:hypothetical protein [Candidatus Falkowbacteria bacterium]